MRSDEKGNSARIAMWYKDVPITSEILTTLEGEITKESWKYLIGKMCLAEKNKRSDNERVSDIYEQIGKDFGYVHPSLKRLVNYANAIDRIQKILPEIASDILNGKTRLSLPDAIILAKMEFPDICNIVMRLTSEKTPAAIIFSEQQALKKKVERRGRPKKVNPEIPRASVKDTPTYDPDAQINGLAFTIPSWVSMIERAFAASDFSAVSPCVLDRFVGELKKLTVAAETVTTIILEGK